MLRPTGFFRAKTNSVIRLGAALVERFDGEVPGRLEDLVTLPGVGRKTANVVLGNAFGVPGITVDTHFGRLARRFGWTDRGGPGQGRARRRRAVPAARSGRCSQPRVIFHGRRICHAQEAGLRRLPGRRAGARPTARARPTPRRRAKLLEYELAPGALVRPTRRRGRFPTTCRRDRRASSHAAYDDAHDDGHRTAAPPGESA